MNIRNHRNRIVIHTTGWLRGSPRNRIVNRLKPINDPLRIQIRNDLYDITGCHNIPEQYLNIYNRLVDMYP
jgi:hypothetical protein